MIFFYLSAFTLLAVFTGAGAMLGGHGGKSDYSLGGRKAGAAGVTGILLGALVGGASTVGTVQMAYSYGLTAWWFTLGGGIGCLLLGLRFAVPLRNSEVTTIADYLEKSFGGRLGASIALTATISSSAGTFISICSQFISCIALIRGVVPLPATAAAAAAALAIWGFIAAGGIKGFSKLGEAKIIVLYIVLIVCAAAACRSIGLGTAAHKLGFHPWFNIFGRGFFPELGYFASMIAGVFTTQIYIQAIEAASDAATARKGALLSAILMPPMGLLGSWIGISVRARGVVIPPDRVISWFITDTFPPLLGGLIWGGLLITVIGAAAGLILGVAANIAKNFIPKKFMQRLSEKHSNADARIQREIVFVIILVAALLGLGGADSMILEWSFLSMGLRGAGTFFPFVISLLAPGALASKWALAASIGGLAGMLLWAFAGLPLDPLFAGLAVSFAFCAAGIMIARRSCPHI